MFGQLLLILRTRTRLTQVELASVLGMNRRSIQNWETGESYPKAGALQRLIAALLQHHAFLAGNERAEAHALWSLVAQNGGSQFRIHSCGAICRRPDPCQRWYGCKGAAMGDKQRAAASNLAWSYRWPLECGPLV